MPQFEHTITPDHMMKRSKRLEPPLKLQTGHRIIRVYKIEKKQIERPREPEYTLSDLFALEAELKPLLR